MGNRKSKELKDPEEPETILPKSITQLLYYYSLNLQNDLILSGISPDYIFEISENLSLEGFHVHIENESLHVRVDHKYHKTDIRNYKDYLENKIFEYAWSKAYEAISIVKRNLNSHKKSWGDDEWKYYTFCVRFDSYISRAQMIFSSDYFVTLFKEKLKDETGVKVLNIDIKDESFTTLVTFVWDPTVDENKP